MIRGHEPQRATARFIIIFSFFSGSWNLIISLLEKKEKDFLLTFFSEFFFFAPGGRNLLLLKKRKKENFFAANDFYWKIFMFCSQRAEFSHFSMPKQSKGSVFGDWLEESIIKKKKTFPGY